VVVAARWLVLFGWVAVATAAYLHLPPPTVASADGGLTQFLPENSPALAVERDSAAHFPFPLLSHTMVVQRNADGLPRNTQAKVVSAAADVNDGPPGDLEGITGAVPILNTAGLLPFSRERSTTAVTYLAFDPKTSPAEQEQLAHRYADHYFAALPNGGDVVGATGVTVNRLAQGRLIDERLTWVELAAILAVVLVVGWEFRSVLAPVVTVLVAAVSYVVATRVVVWGGQQLDIEVPSELEPLIVVLLLGVVTDYSVFFLNGTRSRLRAGDEPKAAVRHAVVTNVVWVVGAGTAVAAGAAVLIVAQLGIFHGLGPGLAVTVLVALAVSITLVPALLAILGRAVFWPRVPRPEHAEPGGARQSEPRAGMLRVLTRRPVALLVVLLVGISLGAAAWQLRGASMGVSLSGLPADTETSRAEAAAAEGFAPGVVAPTSVLVSGTDVTTHGQALDRLQQLVADQPGVAGVLGAGSVPSEARTRVFLAQDQQAARFVVVLDSPPLDGVAIDHLNLLRERLPSLARQAGLDGVTTGVGGDSAFAADIVATVRSDMVRVGGLAILVELLILLLFLRSVLAPIYLLLGDLLALAATLGITTLVLEQVLGYSDWSFYVPFAVVVLLISFGSDYEIFLVGGIWDAAGSRSLRSAVVGAGSRATRAITIAGIALTLSFATLALIPLHAFREFAVAMVVGVLVDVFVVRQLLAPSLVTLFGRAGSWPRHRRASRVEVR
jgi:RND superfamily putative drug exporter